MEMGIGCCCGTIDPCFVTYSKSRKFDFTNIRIEFPSGFSRPAVSEICTYHRTEFETVNTIRTRDEIHYRKFLDAALIPTETNLRKFHDTPEAGIRSGLGYGAEPEIPDTLPNRCQWLWNDVSAHEAIVNNGHWSGIPTTAGIDWINTYTPVNPVDASSPWGRVLTKTSDPREDLCVSGATTCIPWFRYMYNYATASHAIGLSAMFGAVPYSTSQYNYTTGLMQPLYYAPGAEERFWVVRVQSYLSSSSVSELTDTSKITGNHGTVGSTSMTRVAAPPSGSVFFYQVFPQGCLIGSGNSTRAGSSALIEYAKVIEPSDFERDVNGDHVGITLPFNMANKDFDHPFTGSDTGFTSYPESVTLTFSAE